MKRIYVIVTSYQVRDAKGLLISGGHVPLSSKNIFKNTFTIFIFYFNIY